MNKSWQYYAYDMQAALEAEISIDGQKFFLNKIESQLLDSLISRVTISDALIKASEIWVASGNLNNGRQMRNTGKCDFTNFGAKNASAGFFGNVIDRSSCRKINNDIAGGFRQDEFCCKC